MSGFLSLCESVTLLVYYEDEQAKKVKKSE